MPLYAYARLFFSWGFTVRPPGLSAGGPSLPVPPPSTIVGALARGLASIRGWPEVVVETRGPRERVEPVYSQAYRLARHLLGVGALVLGPVAFYRDIMKYSTLPYQKPSNIERDSRVWFSAQNFGLIMAPSAEMVFVAVFSDEVEKIGVTREVLRAAAASLERIGSRESIVHVIEAEAGYAEETVGGETMLYAPQDAVENLVGCDHNYSVVTVWDPRAQEAYTRSDPFKLPKLHLVIPMSPRGAPGVYLPSNTATTGKFMLRLKPHWRSYTGDWPKQLGVVAALPGGESA